jgi:hypothetical protein
MNDILFWIFHIAFWLFVATGNVFENKKVKTVCYYAQSACLGGMFMFLLQSSFS